MGMTLTIGLCIAGFIVLVWMIYVFNQFIHLKNASNQALSNMDVFFKKRSDLIPNLVEIVKGYAKHEKDTLNAVILARNNALVTKKGERKAKAEAKVGSSIDSVFALGENYPELKANTNFLDLQFQLQKMEMEIADARTVYNQKATDFNNKRESFPTSIVAFLMGMRKRTLFKASSSDRKGLKIKF